MSIVKHTDKRSGVTYVYESESYWDKEKKQPRNRRKLIGKIDPETGEVVPTRNRANSKAKASDGNHSDATAELRECRKLLDEESKRLEIVVSENESLKAKQKQIIKQVKQLLKLIEE